MAKQVLQLKQKNSAYRNQVNPNANISRILMLILTLFVLFMLVFFKTALRIENTLISIANNTSHANSINIENIHNNYYIRGNASIAVYTSLSASEIYYLTISLSKGNKTLDSIKISNYGNNIYLIYPNPSNKTISSTQIPIFIPSRQYVVVFSGLEAFSEYNVSLSGTIRPYCTKICPMANAGSVNSIGVNTIHVIGIGETAVNISTSSLSVNTLGNYPVRINSSNTTSAGALPSFILYVHTYKIVTTGANNSIVNVTLTAA